MGETMIEFGLRDEADAALAAMVETFLSKGPFNVKDLWDREISVKCLSAWSVVPIEMEMRQSCMTNCACDSQEEAEAVCALLNYRHYKAK